MKLIRLFVTGAVLFLHTTLLLAQANDPCKALLEKYYRKMAHVYDTNKDKTGYLHLSVKSTPNKASAMPKPTVTAQSVDIKIVTDKSRMYYESTYLNIYRDSKNTFTIIHPQKLIVWNKTQPSKDKNDEVLDKIVALQGDFVSRSEVKSCLSSKTDPAVKLIEMIPFTGTEKTAKEEPNIRKITYAYHTKEKRITGMTVEYSPKRRDIRQEFTFYESNPDYKLETRRSAYACVFNDQQKLLSRYRGYKVTSRN